MAEALGNKEIEKKFYIRSYILVRACNLAVEFNPYGGEFWF